MGDIVSLVEKAAAEFSDEETRRMTEKVKNAEFDFNDFMQQAKMVATMGSLGGVAKMMPGMGGISSDQIRAAESRLKKNQAMINSMTKEERQTPDLLIADAAARSRLDRIAKASGTKLTDVQAFISDFQRMRTMMSRMAKSSEMMDPAMATGGEEGGDMALAGNRAARRASKKKKNSGRGGGGGFG